MDDFQWLDLQVFHRHLLSVKLTHLLFPIIVFTIFRFNMILITKFAYVKPHIFVYSSRLFHMGVVLNMYPVSIGFVSFKILKEDVPGYSKVIVCKVSPDNMVL